jgi:hypothetical protein
MGATDSQIVFDIQRSLGLRRMHIGHVLRERPGMRETSSTVLAFVRTFTAVNAHVNVQVTSRRELMAANVAAVWTRSSMNHHMPLQYAPRGKLPRTYVTDERLLSSVHAHVQLETVFPHESGATFLTRERFDTGVNFQVKLQQRRTFEKTTAHVTHVGALVGMCFFVIVSGARLCKSFATYPAFARPFAGMYVHVNAHHINIISVISAYIANTRFADMQFDVFL